MDERNEKNCCGRQAGCDEAEKAVDNKIFATEEITVEEIAIDGICGVY